MDPAANVHHAAQDDPTPCEPPWTGWIETTGDALLILEAARRGLIPRVTRRLVDSERKMITSGSVFVFDEDESGIKRWTDGFFWSPSRILGNFLLYRETDKKSNLRGQKGQGGSLLAAEGPSNRDSSTLSRPKNGDGNEMDRARERSLFGSLTNSKKFKSQGMMKKTFSLTIGGVAQHLISYYKVEDVENGRLRTPSSLPELASLEISPEYLDKTHFRVPPRVEYDSDGVPRYRGEADDPDSPHLGLSDMAPVSPTSKKRVVAQPQKRYEPYPGRRKPGTRSSPGSEIVSPGVHASTSYPSVNSNESTIAAYYQPPTPTQGYPLPVVPTPSVFPLAPAGFNPFVPSPSPQQQQQQQAQQGQGSVVPYRQNQSSYAGAAPGGSSSPPTETANGSSSYQAQMAQRGQTQGQGQGGQTQQQGGQGGRAYYPSFSTIYAAPVPVTSSPTPGPSSASPTAPSPSPSTQTHHTTQAQQQTAPQSHSQMSYPQSPVQMMPMGTVGVVPGMGLVGVVPGVAYYPMWRSGSAMPGQGGHNGHGQDRRGHGAGGPGGGQGAMIAPLE